MKDLIVRFIGAATRNTGRVKSAKAGDKTKVENSLKRLQPDFHEYCFKGIGKWLQGMDGDVLLRALTYLLTIGVIGLPLHDAIAVNTEQAELAKEAIELAWISTFQFEFLPKISTK